MNFDIRKSVAVPAVILIFALVLLNLIARNWYHRVDLTDTKMYSLSSSTKQVIERIDDLLRSTSAKIKITAGAATDLRKSKFMTISTSLLLMIVQSWPKRNQ